MSVRDLPRWFELSDGTNSYRASLYEALKYQESIEWIRGGEVINMMDGGAIYEENWAKRSVTISGSGGMPLGIYNLDFSLPITLKCGTPRTVTSATNSFVLPTNRTDTGYTPVTLKEVEGVWVPLTASGTPTRYMVVYYPVITAFFTRPTNNYQWDDPMPASWSLSGIETTAGA